MGVVGSARPCLSIKQTRLVSNLRNDHKFEEMTLKVRTFEWLGKIRREWGGGMEDSECSETQECQD